MNICIVKSQRGLVGDDSLLPGKQANGCVGAVPISCNRYFTDSISMWVAA